MENLLIIWDGETQPLSAWRIKCIERAAELYPTVDMICITKAPEVLPKCVTYWPDWAEYEKRLWTRYYLASKSPRELSDFFRLMFLAANPRTLYIDTDMYLKEPIPETEKMSKFGPDISAIWNGDEAGFFKHCLKYRFGNTLRDVWRHFPVVMQDISEYCQHKENYE